MYISLCNRSLKVWGHFDPKHLKCCPFLTLIKGYILSKHNITLIIDCHCICIFQTLATQNTFHKLECVLLCTHTHTHKHTHIP